MTLRHRGILALIPVCLLLAAACKATSGTDHTGESIAPAAEAVVVHTLEDKPEDPHTTLLPGPPLSGQLPSGTVANGKTTAQPFDGTPKVGALFFTVGGVVSIHYCTAGVVHSPSGNLIVTAAHCVHNKIFGGYQNHIVFVPGYHQDFAPYGVWVATTAYLDQRWIDSEDPDADVAFLTVRQVGGGKTPLENAVGSLNFTANPGYTNAVHVVSYPLTAIKPVGCAGTTSKFSDTQVRFDCSGLPEGASGSPFMTDDGKLVGVLGGYQQGGNSPDTSYSTYLGDRIAKIFKTASGS